MGVDKPFLADIVDVVAAIFAEVFPEIGDKRAYIKKVVQMEEDRFGATLLQGLDLLNKHIEDLRAAGGKILDGAAAFRLYDTYGFPWELTQEILSENGMSMDKAAFDAAMSEQRERARAARGDNERIVLPDLSGVISEPLAQDACADTARIVVILKDARSRTRRATARKRRSSSA
jgi:alanyl-tRNA synthetase